MKSLLTFAAYLGFGFLVTRAVRRSRDANRFTVALIIFSVGLALYGLFSLFYAAPKIAGWKNPLDTGARVSATLVNPDHFASYLLMAIYLTFGYLAAFLKKLPPVLRAEPSAALGEYPQRRRVLHPQGISAAFPDGGDGGGDALHPVARGGHRLFRIHGLLFSPAFSQDQETGLSSAHGPASHLRRLLHPGGGRRPTSPKDRRYPKGMAPV